MRRRGVAGVATAAGRAPGCWSETQQPRPEIAGRRPPRRVIASGGIIDHGRLKRRDQCRRSQKPCREMFQHVVGQPFLFGVVIIKAIFI